MMVLLGWYTLYSGYLLGISLFKGLLGGVKQLGYHHFPYRPLKIDGWDPFLLGNPSSRFLWESKPTINSSRSFQKDHYFSSLRISDWTLQWRGERTCMTQGCIGPQKSHWTEGSGFLG